MPYTTSAWAQHSIPGLSLHAQNRVSCLGGFTNFTKSTFHSASWYVASQRCTLPKNALSQRSLLVPLEALVHRSIECWIMVSVGQSRERQRETSTTAISMLSVIVKQGYRCVSSTTVWLSTLVESLLPAWPVCLLDTGPSCNHPAKWCLPWIASIHWFGIPWFFYSLWLATIRLSFDFYGMLLRNGM